MCRINIYFFRHFDIILGVFQAFVISGWQGTVTILSPPTSRIFIFNHQRWCNMRPFQSASCYHTPKIMSMLWLLQDNRKKKTQHILNPQNFDSLRDASSKRSEFLYKAMAAKMARSSEWVPRINVDGFGLTIKTKLLGLIEQFLLRTFPQAAFSSHSAPSQQGVVPHMTQVALFFSNGQQVVLCIIPICLSLLPCFQWKYWIGQTMLILYWRF